MNLDELKIIAEKDLPVTNDEHIDQESYKNQVIKQKWLDFKSDFELDAHQHEQTINNSTERSGSTMVVKQMQRSMLQNPLI